MSCLLSQFRKTVLGRSSLHTAEFMIIAIKSLFICLLLFKSLAKSNRIAKSVFIFQIGVFVTGNIFTLQC